LRFRLGLVVGVLLLGCGQERDEVAPPPPVPLVAADASPPVAGPPPLYALGTRSEDDVLRELGAVPPWQAVIDRAHYLGRRGREGVVYGTLIAGDGLPLVLVDESEGDGLLGLELQVPASLAVTGGQRLLAWGAWWPRDGGWHWRATRVALLPGPGKVTARPPGLEPSEPGEMPADATPVSMAASGDRVAFVVRDIPLEPKDGWAVSDPESDAIVARVVLPGERGSYGGQDLRAAAELWRLRRGQLYVGDTRRVFRPKISLTLPVVYLSGRPMPVR